MAKLFKILLWTIVSLVLIIVLAAVLITVLVDPNDYKGEISQQVKQQTGRDLTISGDINLSISLPLSVSLDLGAIELSNAKGFTDKPFAQIKSASLYVAIMPLITEKRLDIGEIKLDGMQLNLIKNKSGVTNWADLSAEKPANPAVDAKKTTDSKKSDDASSMSLSAIKVAGVNISDAHISWLDEQSGQSFNLSKSNIKISDLVEDKAFNIDISSQFSSNQPALSGDISIKTTPTISLSKQVFHLAKTNLTLNVAGKTIPGGKNTTRLTGDIVFNGVAQTLKINDMQFNSFDLAIKGLFEAKQLNKDPQFSGNIKIEPFSPKQLAQTLGAALPKMKEDKALNTAQMALNFNGNSHAVKISQFKATLDDTILDGKLSIKNFSKPFYNFDLKLNQLNLDYYALAASEATSTQASTNKKKTSTKPVAVNKSKVETPLLPIEMLRQLNLSGQLSIAQFIAGGAKMTDVIIVLKGNNGLVQLSPLTAKLYKGSIKLNTDINVRGKTPKLTINQNLKDVSLGDLLQDTTQTQEFTGDANISTKITTYGNTQSQLTKNSNGSISLLVTNGHVKKLDIISTLRKAHALYKGKSAPTEKQDSNTKFTELKGTFIVKKGVLTNNNLASKSPVMQLTGKGYIDLPKEYLDYTLNIHLLNSLNIDKKSDSNDLTNKAIPYTIKGPFSKLSEDANISKVLEKEAKKAIEKKLNKEIEKKYGDKYKNLLKF